LWTLPPNPTMRQLSVIVNFSATKFIVYCHWNAPQNFSDNPLP
jgi:hypothetical protein